MAPTSEERSEVAARLRKVTDGERAAMFLEEILDGTLGRGCRDEECQISGKLILLRLADLIDPTCDIAIGQVDDDEWGAHEIYECCSNCGNQNMRDRFTGKPYRFCPNCGARVVERGEG